MLKIKITTELKDVVKPFMNEYMSFDDGEYEIIVGWDLAKQRGANILNHKINEKTWWTFSPREKRKIFEEHIKKFFNDLLLDLTNKIVINNIDPFVFKTKDDLIFHLENNVRGCTGYLFNDKLYIYCGENIYHLDIGLLGFMSWDILSEIRAIIKLKESIKKPRILKDLDIKYMPYFNGKKDNIISNIH